MTKKCKYAALPLLLTALSLLLLSCGGSMQTETVETLPYVNELFYDLSREQGTVDFVMFRVGKADAMLISTENCNILIDTGEKNDQDADKIIEYLKAQNITRLDAVFVSNALTDNIGGYERICQAVEVAEVIEPLYNATGHRYTKFLRTVLQSGAALTSVSEITECTFDDITITCYPADNPVSYTTEQDMSLVLAVTHGENAFLLCGNIREPRISEVTETITDTFDVVKLPDHGIWFDDIDMFLTQYAPESVLISDSVLNEVSYDTLALLDEMDIAYYRTKDAYICIRSDGETLKYTQY